MEPTCIPRDTDRRWNLALIESVSAPARLPRSSLTIPPVPPELHWDPLIAALAEYAARPPAVDAETLDTARVCLLDSLGCALRALESAPCRRLLGPVVPEAMLAGGVAIPGTPWELEPVRAAFNLGCQIRWLDFNDTWLAAEWGHPSDNFGGLLAMAAYLARRNRGVGAAPLAVRDLLLSAIQAYEIQGVLALENSFNRVGLDHVLLVRVATAATATAMLGGTEEQIANAISNAWLDGGALRTYRHWPNTGSRKSWAAGDATSRGVQLALWSVAGEPGYRTALSAPKWGFQDVLFGGRPLVLARPLESYVMKHILFKVSFPAEFHAQTAVEAAVRLHPYVISRLDDIAGIEIRTHESAIRIIDKTGPLRNPADRDHCLQYMTAVGLLKQGLTVEDYEDAVAVDPRIDRLRELMRVVEEPRYSRAYLDPNLRSIANAVQVFFADGTATEQIAVEFPLGHRRRRQEARPLLREKYRTSLSERFSSHRTAQLLALWDDPTSLDSLAADEFLQLFAAPVARPDTLADKGLPRP